MERLGFRSGERVNLMVVRRADPRRWDLARLSSTSNQEDLSLSEQGLADWANSLDKTGVVEPGRGLVDGPRGISASGTDRSPARCDLAE